MSVPLVATAIAHGPIHKPLRRFQCAGSMEADPLLSPLVAATRLRLDTKVALSAVMSSAKALQAAAAAVAATTTRM